VSDSLQDQLRAENEAWAGRGLRRELALPDGVDFTSNDYLALARDPRVVAAARVAIGEFGAGAPAARLLRGHLAPHAEAERGAAAWCGDQAALLFPSGWQANAALIGALTDRQDVVFSDRLNHASLIDAVRGGHARRVVWKHSDLADLESQLARHADARRRLIACEHVYSMDGDRAPLEGIFALAERFDAWVVLDEAHAAGLYPFARHPRLIARMFTGGKALGLSGGFVGGSEALIELLVNRGRSFVFTTATPPATAAALAEAIRVARAEPERAARAHAAAARLRAALTAAGVDCPGESPVVPVLLGEQARALAVAERVRAAGFDVRAVRPPTVPPGTSRLRVVCHADHADDQIDGLAAAIAEAVTDRPGSPGASGAAPAASAGEGSRDQQLARAIVVAGTDTDVGKTWFSADLVRALHEAGHPVRYFKPAQTGCSSDTRTVLERSGLGPAHAPPPAVELPLGASVDQAARAAGVEVSVEQVLDATLAHLTQEPDPVWVIECAGGLLVPFNERETQADLLERLGLPVVLVARSGLGTLNHTLLTVEAMRRRSVPLLGVHLVGPRHYANELSLSQQGVPLLSGAAAAAALLPNVPARPAQARSDR